jgi:serine/threonine protein kinase
MSASADESQLACPKCGTPLQRGGHSAGQCFVCLLELALDEEEDVATSERFDHYQIATHIDGTPVELGRGAMGVTFKASDTALGNYVALKVLDARIAAHPEARERFLREARAAARLRHPNVASVFYYGVRKTDGQCFYAMELVDGETLEARLRRAGPLPPALALEVIAQVARALVAAEAQGLVHRDLKPANLMLVEGPELAVKVIDFGLAKAVVPAGSEADLTHGGFVGTPAFASPEQFTGTSVDVRSDLYSLGITLWEMLIGQTPFRGSPTGVMYQHQHAPLPLGQLEGVPQPVVVLVEVLLEKDPGRRFQRPAELLEAIPKVAVAIESGRRITRQSFRKIPASKSSAVGRPRRAKPGPNKISIARLPITGSDVFGREQDIAFLDETWANPSSNIVTIVAWAGAGKSTLVNHWLRRMAAEHYRSAKLIFGWSFYRQGSSGGTSSADEFLDAALAWFEDPDPRLGTAWEKGERLAKLVAHRRTLLILDGLEPLQNPPGPQEGRVREPSLQALLRELAAFNKGLCVITTRLPVADLADHERSSALRLDLEQLSGDAGAKLLRALGVKGEEAELRSASDAFQGHCLALTLLGSYLTDVYNGDVRRHSEVSGHLAQDVRQGVHARKVMESYQTWLGEGPQLSILRMLGLFDRPADEEAIGTLLKSPAIPGLTESLTDLSPIEWRTIVSRLRRARLLAGEDPHSPGHLDAHPLVREYFGEQLRNQPGEAWKECNRRLYNYYRMLAPELPDTLREMEPLFLSVICACNADLFRDALHEVYIPRIQRGDSAFAAKVLWARGALLSVLAHFFEQGRWGSPAETDFQEQSLTAEDQLFILMQAASYLTTTLGLGVRQARICYERAEPLCRSLGRPLLLCVTLIGQWRYSLYSDKMTATMQIAERVHALAEEQNDATIMIEAYRALACTLYFLGDFETARQYSTLGVQIWRSGKVRSHTEDPYTPVVACLCFLAVSQWHFGEITACHSNILEAISLAKELNDMHGLAVALVFAALVAHLEHDPSGVEHLASEVVELSTRQNFAAWRAMGTVLRGWARSASGDTIVGISWIEHGIAGLRATESTREVPHCLGLKAEALHLAHRTSEALEAIREAEKIVERSEEREWCAELQRLRGVFLAKMGATRAEIEKAFSNAIRTSKQQKSISLEKRAEETYAEYRRQNASGF